MRKTIKKFIYITCIALAFTACDDKLEITPKGQTTLETVDDLALLLNQEYDLMIMPFSDLGLICDESLGSSESVSEMLSQTKTLNYAYLTYDEKVEPRNLVTTRRKVRGSLQVHQLYERHSGQSRRCLWRQPHESHHQGTGTSIASLLPLSARQHLCRTI